MPKRKSPKQPIKKPNLRHPETKMLGPLAPIAVGGAKAVKRLPKWLDAIKRVADHDEIARQEMLDKARKLRDKKKANPKPGVRKGRNNPRKGK